MTEPKINIEPKISNSNTARRVYAADDLPDDIRAAISNARVPAEYADLDKNELPKIS